MAVKDLTRTSLVVGAYRRGQSIEQIARSHNISPVRVSQILRDDAAAQSRRGPANPPPTNARAAD